MPIKLENGNKWLLKEVNHVLDLRKNLISTRQLGSERYLTTFTNRTWKVTKGALVVAKGEKVGTLHLCKDNVDSSIDLASTEIDTTWWHHRIGHMSEKGMQILQSRKLFTSLKNNMKISHHCRKTGINFKNMMNNKREIMKNKNKNPYHSL